MVPLDFWTNTTEILFVTDQVCMCMYVCICVYMYVLMLFVGKNGECLLGMIFVNCAFYTRNIKIKISIIYVERLIGKIILLLLNISKIKIKKNEVR